MTSLPLADDEPRIYQAAEPPAAPMGLGWTGLLVVGGLALVLRLIHLGHTPHYDEFFHVLAARSLLEQGDLCIHNCRSPYTRAALFTYLVAGSFKLFGISLVAARIPSVIVGALWAVVVGWWTGRVGGRAAGWIAGLLVALDPGAIYLSQIARFYALHAAVFWVGAAAVYFALEPEQTPRRRLRWLITAAVAFLIALQLQVTTMIGLSGVGAWVAIVQGPSVLRRVRTQRAWRIGAGVVLVCGLAALVYAASTGLLAGLWRTYRWTNLWANENSSDPRFFFYFFLHQYEWLWSLLPIAAAVALYQRPRPALFLITVFAVGFAFHSTAGFKAFRVVYYLMPLMLALWALALTGLVPPLVRLARQVPGRVFGWTGLRAERVAVAVLGIVFAGFLLIGNTMLATTRLMLTRSDDNYPVGNMPYRGYANWGAAAPEIKPLLPGADIVVVTAVNKALWYLGRADVAISANQMFLGDGRFTPEFTPDRQAGVPLIRNPESFLRLLACYPTGVVVVDMAHWKRASAVSDTVSRLIEHYATRIPIEGTSSIRAFRWDHAVPMAGESCQPRPLDPAALPKSTGAGGARGREPQPVEEDD